MGLAALLSLSACFHDEDLTPLPIVTEGCLTDVAYEPARRLVGVYCADCHAQGGHNATHKDAWGHAIQLDTRQEWLDGKKHLLIRLQPAVATDEDPPVDVMPQLSFPFQPTQAERDTLIEWIKRGSPNTVSGFE